MCALQTGRSYPRIGTLVILYRETAWISVRRTSARSVRNVIRAGSGSSGTLDLRHI
jgi:hypothetical protein